MAARVYIDNIVIHPNAWGPFRGGSCHMFSELDSESVAELHRIAAAIGLKREWFQHEKRDGGHYDLTPQKARRAIKFPSVSRLTRSESVAVWRKNRAIVGGRVASEHAVREQGTAPVDACGEAGDGGPLGR